MLIVLIALVFHGMKHPQDPELQFHTDDASLILSTTIPLKFLGLLDGVGKTAVQRFVLGKARRLPCTDI